MKRTEKEQLVAQWSEKFKMAKAVILTEYRGLKVSELTELKREVRKLAGDLRVVKNRLVKRALQGSELAALEEHFKGPTAVAVSAGDPVNLSKLLAKYVGSFAPFKFKVGFLSGKIISAREIENLSKLPSKEELYAKLLGTLAAPATNLARLLQAVPQKLARTLKEIEKQKGGSHG